MRTNKWKKFRMVVTRLLESPTPRDKEEAHAMALGGKENKEGRTIVVVRTGPQDESNASCYFHYR